MNCKTASHAIHDTLRFPALEATLNHAVVSHIVTRTEPKPFVHDVKARNMLCYTRLRVTNILR